MRIQQMFHDDIDRKINGVVKVDQDTADVLKQEVKEYVRDHRGVGINEVAEVCDVDPNLIRQWLREERLELAEDSGIMLACESCGGLIRSGRYCEKCKSNLVNGFNSVLQGKKPVEPSISSHRSQDARMRFLLDDK